MPTATEVQCDLILREAASATYGIVVRTDNPVKARAAIYKYRNLLNDPTFASISIRISPDNTEGAIWILSNKTSNVSLEVANL